MRSTAASVRELSRCESPERRRVRECRGRAPEIAVRPQQREAAAAEDALAFLPVGPALDSAANCVTDLARLFNPPHERHRGHGPLPCPASRRVSGCPARRSAHTVRSRWSSPALAFCTMPWK